MARPKSANALKEYAAKRDFKQTPEPDAKAPKPRPPRSAKAALSFCVQKHLASALHYDFRLEHNGVLLSWAVPKGPSLNPADKRMAIRTEDHPLAYGDFEGVIPSGYGAGVVMLWDRGTWKPETLDIDAALEAGELKFSLDGVKLKGSWVLVRTNRRMGNRESWLLIKHRDHWAGEVDIAEAAADSVKSFTNFAGIFKASPEGPKLASAAAKSASKGEAATMLRQVIREAAGEAENVPKKEKASTTKTAAVAKKKPAAAKRQAKSKASGKAASAPSAAGRSEPKFTNQTKVLFPATGFTKGDLIDYYRQAAPLILPHLRGRAVTLKRYPDGVDGKHFFEKRCASHRPEWVKTVRVDTSQAGDIDYCVIDDLRTLLWAANLAAIELHVPLAYADKPDTPTAIVFDLDPGPPAGLEEAAKVAFQLRDLLSAAGLQAFPKLSGSKGIHMLVPLNTPGVTFDQTKQFARAVALMLQKQNPDEVTATMSRSIRGGKVFIDWSQNDRAKTNVCVYSVRATPTATISTPLDWAAMKKKLTPLTADGKLKSANDFAQVLTMKQKLPVV